MGQYFRALVIKDRKKRETNKYGVTMPPTVSAYFLASADYTEFGFSKLVENYCIGNEYTDTVVSQLVRDPHDWRTVLLAYVGDYSEKGQDVQIDATLYEYRYDIWDAHDAVWNRYGEKVLRKKNAKRTVDTKKDRLYAWDRTLKEYVKLFDLVSDDDMLNPINPLPVLCATSNGQGGGDYDGANNGLAGRWAFHDIVVTDRAPTEGDGYTELVPRFTHRRCD